MTGLFASLDTHAHSNIGGSSLPSTGTTTSPSTAAAAPPAGVDRLEQDELDGTRVVSLVFRLLTLPIQLVSTAALVGLDVYTVKHLVGETTSEFDASWVQNRVWDLLLSPCAFSFSLCIP